VHRVTDQVGDAPYYLTQAFLAHMLGIRRAGVTTVAELLQHAGVVEYRRDRMTLLRTMTGDVETKAKELAVVTLRNWPCASEPSRSHTVTHRQHTPIRMP
jgi:hypothetical protein